MGDLAVRTENLGKRYRLAQRAPYRTLREAIVSRSARLLRGRRTAESDGALLWALRGVSFEVRAGEVLGIVGGNGAGKSTLLKVLARITEPTEGAAEIRGRVGSLLEVGTGFHPELTGRENVYLNGAILGMRKAEIDRRFDEIVGFAEVERFLETPVKHYSSGMYMRLAFAVAAHLPSEILLVDEVLAVGDAKFQRKCLGKMSEVAHAGRTVLFVSHNMQAVRQLCGRALWIRAGTVAGEGSPSDVVEDYLREGPAAQSASDILRIVRELPADPAFRLESVEIRQDGQRVGRVTNGLPLDIEIGYEVLRRTTGLRVFFDVYDTEGTLLFRSFNDEQSDGIPTTDPGRFVSLARLPADLLAPRRYELRIFGTIYNVRMCVPEPGVRIPLEVVSSGLANRAYPAEPIRGKLAPAIEWRTSRRREADHEA